jgi:toxin ParE1/3/4
MVEIEKKTVKISPFFDSDIIDVFSYGEETFGYSAAKIFIGEIYNYVWNLDSMYLMHVECRFLRTKQKMYRNIILGSYLIIYRITKTDIEVLRILSAHRSISKIKKTKSIKIL